MKKPRERAGDGHRPEREFFTPLDRISLTRTDLGKGSFQASLLSTLPPVGFTRHPKLNAGKHLKAPTCGEENGS